MHIRLQILSLGLFLQIHFCTAQAGFSQLPYFPKEPTVSIPDSVYRFPSFEYGRITLSTGFTPGQELRFNYNLFTGQMDMITTKGDTVQIKRIKELQLITLTNGLFFHSYKVGYLEILRKSMVSLGVLNTLVTAYPTTATHSYIRSTKGAGPDAYYANQATYYFLDRDNKVYKTIPSSMKKLFYDHKKEVNSYISKNKVNFKNEAELSSMLDYFESLNKHE